MEKRINITIMDEITEEEYDEEIVFSLYGEQGNITVSLGKNKKFTDVFNKKNLVESLKKEINNIEFAPAEFKADAFLEYFNYILENIDDIYSKVDSITLKLINEDPLNYIKEHEELLKNKKIAIAERLELGDYVKALALKEKYKDYYDRIYFFMENNSEFAKLSECIDTLEELQKRVSKIDELGFSPFEKLIYIYDKVKKNIYKFEDEGESKSTSRDLIRVLNGDKIVCAGYSKIFDSLCKLSGLDSKLVDLNGVKDDTHGHQRNMVILKDEKYNIDGIYYFDSTWDSKRNQEDVNYINRYRFFAKTKKEILPYDKECDLIEDEAVEDFNTLREKLITIRNSKNFNELIYLYKEIRYLYQTTLNIKTLTFYELCKMTEEEKNNYIDNYINNFDKAVKKFEKKISPETFIEAVMNVREVENKEDAIEYKNTIDDIFNSYKSTGRKLNKAYYSQKEKALMILGLEVPKEKNEEDSFINFYNSIRSQMKKDSEMKKINK